MRKLEWRLGLRRSERVQRRYFFERLHDPDEHIKVESDHGTSDENPAPMAGKLTRVTREDRNREYDQRHDAQRNRRRETMERKEEARHTREHSGDQKPFSLIIQPFAGKQSEQNDQAGKNSDQADQHVNDRVNCAVSWFADYIHFHARCHVTFWFVIRFAFT